MSRMAQMFERLSGLTSVDRERALADLALAEPALAAALAELFEADSDPLGIAEPPETQKLLQCLPLHRDFGGFRLVRPLGRGGMGEVWLGERIQAGVTQQAAVKLMRPDRRGAELDRRFLDEQRIVAQLSHPNIVRLISIGQMPDGSSWLAMDLVEGEPLLAYCDRRRLSLRQRVSLLVKVLGAIQHAHQKLIVHRDLKSEHVLVDRDGEPHLLDFGIARRLDALQPTGPAGGFFSPCNVTPEQLNGDPISVATDVYQLGLLLYGLVCGSEAQAREGASPSELQELVLRRSPRPPSELVSAEAASLRGTNAESLRRDLRGDLDRIVLHALRAAPEERYPTATAFREDLQAWLDCRPVRAVGQGRAYRLRKFVQRHRLVVGVAAAALLLLGGAGLVLLRQELALARAHGEALLARDAAERQRARAEQVRDLLLDLFRAADPALDGVTGDAARIEDAVAGLRRREAVGDIPELTLALAEAAIGLGQHESGLQLLRELEQAPLPQELQRQRLLLLARLAVATQDEADLQARLAAVAPLMTAATELERHQYLRLMSGLLLPTDPRRVLRLTDLDPVPPILLRVRARALLKLGEIDAAEQLLRASLDRSDVGRLQRLGLQQALVTALVDGDQAVEAERESQQLIDAARPLLGADSRAMLGYWNTRAIALAAAGRLEEAVEALDALLDRPDLSAGLRTPLELNRILFGSAMRTPDATTAALLDRHWSDRESLRLGAKRILLLARVRQLVRDRQIEAARGEMALARELLDGTGVESRLLRQWARVLGLNTMAGSIEASTEALTRMDPQLAALESPQPVR